MPRLSVLLIFGGESSEHDVSILSARNVYAAMDSQKYHISLCYIDRAGKWWLIDEWSEDPEANKASQLLIVPGTSSLITSPGGRIIHVDVMLPILHGKYGEDGTIQGLAKMLHAPMVGPSMIGAAITMDKDVTKRLLRDAGIPVVEWLTWVTSTTRPAYEAVIAKLGPVLFIKPANAGSSVGVTKVSSWEEYDEALTLAAQHDSMVLIEKAISAREIELAVLGNSNPQVAKPGEIIVGEEFYTYDDKYAADAKSSVKIPADISDELAQKLQTYAVDAYKATRGTGMARVDFFVTESDEIYLNELNSIPGFTNISMYPKLWHEAGMKYPQLIDKLIELALE